MAKLVEAARVLDFVYMDQLWSGIRALYARLQRHVAVGKPRLHYFWDVLAKKPAGANIDPEDMTRGEFDKVIAGQRGGLAKKRSRVAT